MKAFFAQSSHVFILIFDGELFLDSHSLLLPFRLTLPLLFGQSLYPVDRDIKVKEEGGKGGKKEKRKKGGKRSA